MVLLTDDRRVRGHRPVIATMPQRPPGPREAVARVHKAAPLIPLDADVVVVLRFLQGDATFPLLLGVQLLLVATGLELVLLCSSLRGESAVKRGPCLLHLSSGDKSLLAAPPVGVLLKDVINEPGEILACFSFLPCSALQ
jgi:hypothetical protein